MAERKRQDDVPEAGSLGITRRKAFVALLVERLWPLVLPLACLVALFLILSWFGLFAAMPFVGRVALLALFGLGVAALLYANRRFALPTRLEVDRRIEATSRLAHQPLRAQDDRATNDDPFAAALWREHQKRMAERLSGLASGRPDTRSERLDPFALRAGVALLLVTAFAFSFGPAGGRLGDAFSPPGAGEMAPAARLDAWVTPPPYTGRAPIFLTDAGGGPNGSVSVPEGSVLSIRLSEREGASLRFQPEGGGPAQEIAATEPERPEAAAPTPPASAGDAAGEERSASSQAPAEGPTAAAPTTGPAEYEWPLEASGRAEIATAFSALGAWSFAVVADEDPTVAFRDAPSEGRNGALQLSYTLTDDYGVRQGQALLKLLETQAPGARPLVPAPEIKLSLPRRIKGPAEGRTGVDITESPYAGAKVAMTLQVVDDAGQRGRSEEKVLTLPAKRFTNPLARAVIEQRRILALDANAADRVVEMLDAVTLRGEEFIENPSDYLALRAARTRIATAENDDTLRESLDFLWEIALGIEDGNLSLAERSLRDARERLAEALENGASQEEVDRLMQELRQAMQEYMQALAEAMRNMPPNAQQSMQSMQEIRPQDIERMLDRIEDLARSGSRDAAQQLLSELQQMMDSLQAMRPGQQQPQGESPMQQQMNKMGELLQRQQQLMDRTFDLGRQRYQQEQQDGQPGQPQQGEPQQGQEGQPGQNNQPMTREQLEQALRDLQNQQGQLQKELQAMQEAMRGMGMEPGQGLGEADDAMGQAEGALGQGQDGEAVDQQGRAMEAMRRGARDMMQQMQQAMGQEGQPGQGQPGQGQPGQGGPGFGGQQQQSGRDPLGRPRQTQGPDFGQDVGVPDEIDAQRARRILDAIRERLGDQLSPQMERDYLERLLRTP